MGTDLFPPWNPIVHHWRNFFALLFCLWIHYPIMVRVTDWEPARVIGLAFFVLSKVQLMMVGYVNFCHVANRK